MNVLFPGTFDPFTIGHKMIVDKALQMRMHPMVCFLNNPKKERIFSLDAMVNSVWRIWDGSVEAYHYDLNVSDICKNYGINVIIKGVRNSQDFEYEKNMADYHERFFGIQTILIPTSENISSTMVRELYRLKAFNLMQKTVPEHVYNAIMNEFML